MLDLLRPWQNFYLLLGQASATLIGLLFVAASVGSRIYTREKHPALRVFLSPTVFHFATILVTCLFAVAPDADPATAGGLIGAEGLIGLGYAGAVWRSMVRRNYMASIDLEDRLYYAALPAAGYILIVGAGIGFWRHAAFACVVLAGALGLLLLAGIRNAWDMTLWTVTRSDE